jgi:putative membrane protein
MRRLYEAIVTVVVNGIAIMVTASFMPGIRIDHNSFSTFLILGIVIGLVNGILAPILRFISFPLIIISLGIFALVINALLLLLVGHIVPGLHIDGFWPAFWSAIVLGIIASVLQAILNAIFPKENKGHQARA